MVIGCGAVAQRLYMKPLRQLERRGLVRVVALVDPVPEHAGTLSAFFPGSTPYGSVDDALDATTPELTLILSPAHLHCRQALESLQSGSHVLCEKPMAATDVDCARMNAAAAGNKRVLAIGMNRRFFPAYAQLRQVIEEGLLGPVQSFEYREGHKFEWDVTTPAAFRPRCEGGTGVLFDIGPHAVDYLEWTFGSLRVTQYADDALAGIESNLSMQAAALACTGSIHLSWDFPQTNELRVGCLNGEAVLRLDRFAQFATRTSGTFEPQRITVSYPADAEATPRRRLTPASYGEAVYCQIVQVIRAIQLGEAPAVSGEAGRRCVSLLESALSIAAPMDVAWVDPAQKRALERLHWIRSA
jgi:predicted dehydrogenase